MENPLTSLRMVGAVLKDVATYEACKPITVETPALDMICDLSEFGMGKCRIQQGGAPIVITKQPD